MQPPQPDDSAWQAGVVRRRAMTGPWLGIFTGWLRFMHQRPADTGGLMQNHAPTIYAYSSLEALLEGEKRGGAKSPLPRALGATGRTVTERATG